MDGLSLSIIRYARDIAKSLAAPFLGIAYFLQSGGPVWRFGLSFGHTNHPSNIPAPHFLIPHPPRPPIPLDHFLLVFLTKALLGGAAFVVGTATSAKIIRDVQLRVDSAISDWIVLAPWSVKTACLAFALFGLLFRRQYGDLRAINPFWYIACAIWGLSISLGLPRPESPHPKTPPPGP